VYKIIIFPVLANPKTRVLKIGKLKNRSQSNPRSRPFPRTGWICAIRNAAVLAAVERIELPCGLWSIAPF